MEVKCVKEDVWSEKQTKGQGTDGQTYIYTCTYTCIRHSLCRDDTDAPIA